MLVVWVLCEIGGQADLIPSPLQIGIDGVLRIHFLAPSLLGSFLAQAILRPRRDELVATALLAALVVYPLYAVMAGEDLALVAAVSDSLGIGTLVILGIQALRSPLHGRRSILDVLVPALILPLFVILASSLLFLTAALRPLTFDLYMYLSDAAFGDSLSFSVGQLSTTLPWLVPVCLSVYVALPLALMLVHVLRLKQGTRSNDTLVAFVAVSIVGYFGFMVVPVAGPLYTFGDLFPLRPPDPASMQPVMTLVQPIPRNCMPSLHTAWALLILWSSRPLVLWQRVVAAVFVAVTLFATVVTGFHYVVDLVAAFPLTMAVQAWATRLTDEALRRKAMLVGVALTVGWIALVTVGVGLLQLTPILPWTIATFVIAISIVFERRIDGGGLRVGTPLGDAVDR